MCVRSHVSPALTLQSCMSLHRFGITNETSGSCVKAEAGNWENGRFTELDTFEKSVHGTCLRAYSPAEQTCDPVPGRSSEKPANVLPAAIRSLARFGAENVSGQASDLTPSVLPEKRAR